MKKTYVAGLIMIAVFVFGAVFVPKTLAEKKIKEGRSVIVNGATPEYPVVYLGKAFDKKSVKEVEGYAIIHYAKNNASKPTKPSSDATCYGYIANGAKWKGAPEDWVIDSVNTGDLGGDFVFQGVTNNISKWEDATDGIVGNNSGMNILGSGQLSTLPITPNDTLNDTNEVTFAPIDNAGAIAVTYVWGNFSGPTFNRQIVEWDQIYNSQLPWTTNGIVNPTAMDFNNIATHELGHAVGMADLYTSKCSEQTMYGYANVGQVNKQTLKSGDITGINLLY